MANELMFLLHVPSGHYVYLAKRMGWGWYGTPDDVRDEIESLFDLVERQIAEGGQDEFAIAFEGDERLTHLVAVKDGRVRIWHDERWTDQK